MCQRSVEQIFTLPKAFLTFMVKRPSERESLNVPSFLPSWQLFFFSQSSVRRKQDTAIRGQSLKTVFWLELFVYSKRSQRYTWTNRRVVSFVKNFIDFKRNFQWSCTESDTFCSVFMKHPRLLSSRCCYWHWLSVFSLHFGSVLLDQKIVLCTRNRRKRKYIADQFGAFCIFFVQFFSKKKNKKKKTKKKTDKRKKNVVVRILKLDSRTI